MSYFSDIDILINENASLYADYVKEYQREDKAILRNMVKALKVLGGFLNSDEDNIRLYAAMAVLKGNKK